MIRYVKLVNYKSLVNFTADFMKTQNKPKKLILIYGENGIGKSNFASSFYTLGETMRTMSSIEIWKKLIEDIKEDKNKEIYMSSLKNNFKDIEMIINDIKTINTEDNIVMEFGFRYKDRDGIYRIEMDNQEIVYEKLDYVFNKNKVNFFAFDKDQQYINSNIFSDNKYYEEFKKLIEQYWGKHSFLSILSFEFIDKKNGYVKDRISNGLYDAWFYLRTICTKIRKGNNSEFGTFGSSHLRISDFDKGQISVKYEKELDKIEVFLNDFFPAISSDIRKVYYDKEIKDNILKYKLMVKKLIYGKIIDIDFNLESTGYQNLIKLLPYFISVCEGQTVIIDELDEGIHDLLATNLLINIEDSIKDQLIITTHNTMLIESEIPNDSIYVFNVNRDAFKELVPITSFDGRIHPNVNPRKKYLKGFYGGVPALTIIDFDDLRENLE